MLVLVVVGVVFGVKAVLNKNNNNTQPTATPAPGTTPAPTTTATSTLRVASPDQEASGSGSHYILSIKIAETDAAPVAVISMA